MKFAIKMALLSQFILFSFLGGICFAGTEVDDVFDIQTQEIKVRKKGPPKFKPVSFTHKKHIETYTISCGSCHHDSNKKPLVIKPGDDVARCVSCHSKLEKDKNNKKDIMVLENAMHGNCVGCHKKINEESGQKKGPAPVSCGKCHISTKKK